MLDNLKNKCFEEIIKQRADDNLPKGVSYKKPEIIEKKVEAVNKNGKKSRFIPNCKLSPEDAKVIKHFDSQLNKGKYYQLQGYKIKEGLKKKKQEEEKQERQKMFAGF